MSRLKLTNVETGVGRTSYMASIEIGGRTAGYVQRVNGGTYRAYSDGCMVASASTLADLRAELREHFAAEYPDARDSW